MIALHAKLSLRTFLVLLLSSKRPTIAELAAALQRAILLRRNGPGNKDAITLHRELLEDPRFSVRKERFLQLTAPAVSIAGEALLSCDSSSARVKRAKSMCVNVGAIVSRGPGVGMRRNSHPRAERQDPHFTRDCWRCQSAPGNEVFRTKPVAAGSFAF